MAVIATVGAQTVVAVIVAIWLAAGGVEAEGLAEEVVEAMMSPPLFLAGLLVSQGALGLCAVLSGSLSPIPTRERLGLTRPRCSGWQLALFALGSAFPMVVAFTAARGVATLLPTDDSMELLYGQLTNAWAVPFLLCVGVLPGLTEETLYRGYVQQRLIQRWGPVAGIALSAFLFALCHVAPASMALALIMGLWLGVLAWRTGSIWAGAIGHAAVNTSWNVLVIGQHRWGLPDTLPTPLAVAGVGVALLFFLGSVRELVGLRSPPARD